MLSHLNSYVFQELNQLKTKGSKPAQRLMASYNHLPPWIKDLDHDVHQDLQVMSHQFFVGTTGTGGF